MKGFEWILNHIDETNDVYYVDARNMKAEFVKELYTVENNMTTENWYKRIRSVRFQMSN